MTTQSGNIEARLAALEGDVAALRGAYCHSEIRGFLAAQLRGKTSAANLPFDVEVICGETVEAARLTRPELILDKRGLAELLARTPRLLGAIRENRASAFLRQVCLRLVERLARRLADRLDLPAETLREAWFYCLNMEVWQLLPARHIARHIARMAAGDPVIIPVPSLTFTYLAHSSETHGVELLYLIYELRRRGVAAALLCTDPELAAQTRRDGVARLRLEPYRDLWVVPPMPEPAVKGGKKGRAAMVGGGIRGISHILRMRPDVLRLQSSFTMDPAFGNPDASVLDPRHLPVALNFVGNQAIDDPLLAPVASLHRVTLPHANLAEYFFAVLGGATRAAADHITALVKRHRVNELHICANLFFESSLAAHAVRSAGGKVVLWPHSFNAGDINVLRKPGTFDAVYSPWEPDAKVFRQHFPKVPVTILPNLWLPACEGPREAEANAPTTIVVVANDTIARRVVVNDVESIAGTYSRLFATLAAMAPDVDYLCRPRSQANLQWLWELSGRKKDFPYTIDGPMSVNVPNMVFLFVGQLSSALMEGIVRGIPSLYLREDEDFEDYLDIGAPDCLPTGRLDVVSREIMNCRNAGYRRALIERQISWYQGLMQ